MNTPPEIPVQIPAVLLPKPGTDLRKWATIACDQFTSEPEYWEQAAQLAGDAPSTLNLILPEVYLGSPEEAHRVRDIRRTMQQYLDDQLFTARNSFILVERTVGAKTRHGLMIALDLEMYDYHQGSQTLIRATEGTILDRLPPRIRIRQGAALELPHILVLIDDPAATVIEPLVAMSGSMEPIYDFELMLGGGHLKGYVMDGPDIERHVLTALGGLADPDTFRSRYAVGPDHGVLLFAVGDGNHSLATAKALWEQMKPLAGMDHPARYALVEIGNIHDHGLEFEPIHRVLFDVREDVGRAMLRHFGDKLGLVPCADAEEMIAIVNRQDGPGQAVGYVDERGCSVARLHEPSCNLPVGTLQRFLDEWQAAGGFREIDYVHGTEVVTRLGRRPGNAGFYLTAMNKGDLFKTVILDGALPRKTFSMGEALEKRFYMECRGIV
ncbi:MAG: DUF1015 domain-containing protein [Akkermansiaceae bacterium]|nr:DUF1015 domain-containing protein [Akkermansiaceae bacterium]MCF7732947.1 DUF1015 domain-containing protein [Akkermansiaceae bacterium]